MTGRLIIYLTRGDSHFGGVPMVTFSGKVAAEPDLVQSTPGNFLVIPWM